MVKARGHNGVEVQTPRIGPRNCTKRVNELRHDLRPHLVVRGADVRAYIGGHVRGGAPGLFGKSQGGESRQRNERSTPTRMDHRDPLSGRDKDDRNAVGEA